MTAKEMNDVIQKHCSDISSCEDCAIEKICDSCGGLFDSLCYESECKQAYEIVKSITNNNAVDHPDHYNQGSIECIDAMVSAFGKEATAGFCIINAFKYVWRASNKNGMEDIDKAIWYLTKYKELTGEDLNVE